jgi:alkylhydroperoxidase family enzyme
MPNAWPELSPSDAADALVASVLGPAGVCDAAWRAGAYERARAISRGADEAEVSVIGTLPDLLAQLVDDVARAPQRITDEQFEALYAAGYDADVLYEVTVAAAVGAGVERRTIGMEAIGLWDSTAADRSGVS